MASSLMVEMALLLQARPFAVHFPALVDSRNLFLFALSALFLTFQVQPVHLDKQDAVGQFRFLRDQLNPKQLLPDSLMTNDRIAHKGLQGIGCLSVGGACY